MNCPICDQPTQAVFEKHGYWIHECPACRHRCVNLAASSTHVSQVYGDDYFTEGGAGYSDYLAETELITAHGRRYGQILSRYMTPGRMLDVGAAAGFILKGIGEFGWTGVGLEPNATVAEFGRTRLGMQIEVGALEDFRSSEQFDLVSMIQVIPHFYNLRQALAAAAQMTRPGGYWLIETWNKDSWMARIMGQNWHEYSPPSVLHFFSPQTLAALVKQFGFAEVAHGRPAKKINGGHAKSLLQYKVQSLPLGKPAARLLNLVPDNLAIPYPSYDLFWGLYRKI